MDDDYYSLLGVEPDASTDDIKAAYREMKTGLDGSTADSAKSQVAKLNKAWGVLSDPYQRGRYDASLEGSGAEVVEGDDVEVVEERTSNGRGPRTRPIREPRQVAPPTIELPAGVVFAPRNKRMIAMAIDLAVLFALFVGSQFAIAQLADSQKPEVVDRIDVIQNELDDLHDQKDTADDAAKAAGTDKVKCDDPAVAGDRKTSCDLQKQIDDKEDELADQNKKLQPIISAANGAMFLIGFLYLLLPSLATGATLGKRTQRIRVIRADGSKARIGDEVKRYGILIIVTYGLSIILGPLAAVVVLIGVTRWMNNPNQQGLHDRFAGTVVVADN